MAGGSTTASNCSKSGNSPAAVVGGNPVQTRLDPGQRNSEKTPGAQAIILRGSLASVVRWGGVAAAAQGGGTAGQPRGGALGLGRAARGWMGCRGAAGWLKRESAGHLGEGAGMEGHGNLGELCGLAVPWARRGGEETDRWGQAASETRSPGERSTAGADVWVRVRRERGRNAGVSRWAAARGEGEGRTLGWQRERAWAARREWLGR